MLGDDDVLALYEATVDEVHRYASRLTGGDPVATEELVQETYLGLVRHVRAGGSDVSVGWLLVVCRTRFLDRLRAERRRHRREVVVATWRTSTGERHDGDVLASLALLPAEQRAALVLRYVDDLSVAEVARCLGRSVRAAESLLARGRAAMRAQLGDVAGEVR